MVTCKQFNNGLRAVLNKMEGMLSVSIGVIVNTGSRNESEEENGISHFIEHTVFKGTEKRTAFEISDYIDGIGAQINAFTSKELTCFYTKSTAEHTEDSLEVLSDILFNSTFLKEELEREKGVIKEEINMSEDSPDEVCLDLLSKAYYGDKGLGMTILGSKKNVNRFDVKDVYSYMDKYYCADNIVISVAGNIDFNKVEDLIKKYFADKFTRLKSSDKNQASNGLKKHLYRVKKIEQSHIAFSMKGVSVLDSTTESFDIANTVLGGGMSSRLFQKVREELGLCYSVYSYFSGYRDTGVVEIYAGVNTDSRDNAVEAIVSEVLNFKKHGITEREFLRGKEQVKSSFIMSRESTASQMLLYGKYMLFFNKIFDYEGKIKKLEDITLSNVNEVINNFFDIENSATATVGPKRSALKI